MTRRLTLGTAGHVDHGKTTLVRALTGTDTDRLEEERRRGISIVLGYAELPLGDDLALGVVDVPGHERFVRTMIGGATGVDLALLCVAADDGVMPQTAEHLAILDLLGVRGGVVAVTKADLADAERLAAVERDVRALLGGTALADAPIVRVAADRGEGLDALRDALRAAAAHVPDRSAEGRVRLPIDRSFALRGIGTVVTGTLWSGTLRAGDAVAIRPGRREARVRSLEVHGRAVESASAGARVAVALTGVERDEAPAGATLWTGAPAEPGYRLDAEARVLADATPLRTGEHVDVLLGTSLAPARVVVLEGDELPPDGTGLVQLRLDAPLAALRGDRVVLRRTSPAGTVAGGVVLDPHPPRHAGAPADLERLRLHAEGDPSAIARAALAAGAVRPADLVARGLLDEAEAARALAPSPDVLDLAGWRLAATRYAAIRRAVEGRLADRAREHPLDPGLPIGSVLRDAPWRDALVDRLAADGVLERDGADVRLAGAGEADGAADEAAAPILAELAAAPFATHRQADLVERLDLPADDAWALLQRLDRLGRVARLPDGLVVHRDAYDEAVRIVRDRCAASGQVTLAEVRDATGSSRKVVQALLERMDADGVTRRVGDARILRRSGAS